MEGNISGRPPQIDLEKEKQLHRVITAAIGKGWVSSAHDCSTGGLATTLAESCFGRSLGAVIRMETPLIPRSACSVNPNPEWC